MIAAGTSLAPFRGFIQERAAQFVCGRDIGKTILYYGCRSENYHLYKIYLEKLTELDAIQVKLTFSRQVNVEKNNVPDVLWNDRHEIIDLYRNVERFLYFRRCS